MISKLFNPMVLLVTILNIACSESLWEPYDHLNDPLPEIVFEERNLNDICESLIYVRNQYAIGQNRALISLDQESIPSELANSNISIGFSGLILNDAIDILNGVHGLNLNLVKTSNGLVLRHLASNSKKPAYYAAELDFYIANAESTDVTKAFVRIKNISDMLLSVENTFDGEVAYEKKGMIWSDISVIQDAGPTNIIDLKPNDWMHKSLVCSTVSNELLVQIIIDGEGRWFSWKRP